MAGVGTVASSYIAPGNTWQQYTPQSVHSLVGEGTCKGQQGDVNFAVSPIGISTKHILQFLSRFDNHMGFIAQIFLLIIMY